MKNYNSKFIGAENRKIISLENVKVSVSEIDNRLAIYDVEMRPQSAFEHFCKNNFSFIIPIIGECEVIINEEKYFLQSEEILSIHKSNQSEKILIKNNLDEKINLLLIESNVFFQKQFQENIQQTKINFESKNKWASINDCDEIKIGIFETRFSDEIKLPENADVVAYTINGSFEIENRLINQRDCLSLKTCNTIDFEALTDFAVLLLLMI